MGLALDKSMNDIAVNLYDPEKDQHENACPNAFVCEIFDSNGVQRIYPAWRYHVLYEPIIVNNEQEDNNAKAKGWFKPKRTPITAIQTFNNFYHDLEDLNVRQLCNYAHQEYNIDLPVQAGKAKLLRALWELARVAPKNKGRMVLLAQSVKMNYEETQKEIMRQAGDMSKCQEHEVEEIWL